MAVSTSNNYSPMQRRKRSGGRLTDAPTHFWIYDRGDPLVNEQALREAFPALYIGFKP